MHHCVSHSWEIVFGEPADDVSDVVVIAMLVGGLSIAVRADLMIGALVDVVINVFIVVIVGTLTDAEITVVGAALIALEFAVLATYDEDVLVAVLIDVLAGSPFVTIIVVMPGIDVDVLADMMYVKVI